MPFPTVTSRAAAISTVLLLGSSALLAPQRAFAQGTGVIQGRVQLEDPPPPRRTVNRYQLGQAQAHRIQTLPAVAYLVGPVRGTSAPGSQSSAVMTQQDTTFIPSVVFVQAGGSVEFRNDKDGFQHSILSYSKAANDLKLGHQNPGSSFPWTFPDPGIVELFCEVHEFMRGAVVVTENPYVTIVGGDGSFVIAGVPAGQHTLAVWQNEHEPFEQTVTVEAGGTTTVQVQLRR